MFLLACPKKLWVDYCHFKEHYKMATIDLGKQQAIDVAATIILQINFTENPCQDGNATTSFKNQKKPI